MQDSPIIIQTTLPVDFDEKELAHKLLSDQLAACIHRIANIQSTYTWENTIVSEDEHILHIKTKQSLFNTVSNVILKHHPYDVPEIIAIPIQSMATKYNDWFYRQLKI